MDFLQISGFFNCTHAVRAAADQARTSCSGADFLGGLRELQPVSEKYLSFSDLLEIGGKLGNK